MITFSAQRIHWTYFIALEQDIERLARFVEPSEANLNTYSLEMCRILFAASAECEVVLKQLASYYSVKKTDKFDIKDLMEIVIEHVPGLVTEKVFIPRFGMEFEPWSNWKSKKSPDWWNSYNKVKHHRAQNFKESNLWHTLNSVAALMAAIVYFYRREFSTNDRLPDFQDMLDILFPKSELFYLDSKRYHFKFR